MPNHFQFVFIRETFITGFAVVLVVILVVHVRFCCPPILKQLVAPIAFFLWFSMAHFSHVLLACFLSSKCFRACLAFSHLHSLVVVAVDDVEITIVRSKRSEA